MLSTVLLVATAWGLLTLLGLMLLAAVPSALRRTLLPAAPLVGVAFLVAGLHTTGLFLSVRRGLVVLALIAVATLVVGVVRGSARPLADRSSAGWSLAGLLVGIPFALVALAPSLILDDSRVVSPSANNDAVWYVSVSTWLEDHPITDVPDIPAAPVGSADHGVLADGPAVSALTFPLRVGQELVQASLNVVTGTSPMTTFTPWVAAWVLLLPGGCLAAAALLRLGRGVGLAGGVVMASSVVVVQQVYNQNAASVLGIALAPLVLAGVVAALERDRRMPLLLAGLLLSGLVGTYSEYAPFVAPALAAAAVLRRSGLWVALARAAGVVLVAVAVAPLAWYRALKGLLGVRGGAADAFPSPFRDAPVSVIINRLVGVGPADAASQRSWIALLLAALIVLGVALALLLGPQRGLWIGLLAVAVPFIAVLSAQKLGYTQRRAVEIVLPLVLFISVAGWAALVRRLSRTQFGPERRSLTVARRTVAVVPVLLVTVLLVPLLVFSAVNVRSSLSAFVRADLQPRHVDSDFSDAYQWVADVGGEDGAEVSVLVPNFFDQQWLTLTLGDEEQVEYPAVRPDYFRAESFWSGGVDRYWLVGDGVQVDADPDVLVYANERFRLYDLTRGQAVIAAPYALTHWDTGLRPDGGVTSLGTAQALVVRTAGARTLELTLSVPIGAPLDVQVGVPGAAPVVVEDLSTQPVDLPITLPEGDRPVLVDLTAQASPGDAGPNRIEMAGVQRVP
jgi:hypothetical protein